MFLRTMSSGSLSQGLRMIIYAIWTPRAVNQLFYTGTCIYNKYKKGNGLRLMRFGHLNARIRTFLCFGIVIFVLYLNHNLCF